MSGRRRRTRSDSVPTTQQVAPSSNIGAWTQNQWPQLRAQILAALTTQSANIQRESRSAREQRIRNAIANAVGAQPGSAAVINQRIAWATRAVQINDVRDRLSAALTRNLGSGSLSASRELDPGRQSDLVREIADGFVITVHNDTNGRRRVNFTHPGVLPPSQPEAHWDAVLEVMRRQLQGMPRNMKVSPTGFHLLC